MQAEGKRAPTARRGRGSGWVSSPGRTAAPSPRSSSWPHAGRFRRLAPILAGRRRRHRRWRRCRRDRHRRRDRRGRASSRPASVCSNALYPAAGRGLILDLRRKAFERPVAAHRLLHLLTHRRASSAGSTTTSSALSGPSRGLSGVVTTRSLALTLIVMPAVVADHRAGNACSPDVRDPGPVRGKPRSASSSARRPEHNAAMTSQMTERFSAPGATRVKLFDRPRRRGGRVRRARDGSMTSGSGRRWRWRLRAPSAWCPVSPRP